MASYERLSALDAAFLQIETSTCHMHVAVTMMFDAAPLTCDHGGIDIDRIRDYIAQAIQYVPRYRQRIDYIPLERHPVWVDDAGFNIHYHVRHTAIPRPGTRRQLKRLVGRIISQKLDRARPLWELWVVEGLQDDRFAVIAKVHHCMMDGVAGMDVMAVVLRPDAGATTVERPASWAAREPPSRPQMFADQLRRRVEQVRSIWQQLQRLRHDPQHAIDQLKETAESLATAVRPGMLPASKTVLNPERIGGYRRFDWLRLELPEIKRIKNRLGGTVNDVVLAIVAGAVRRFFIAREVDVEGLDFRVMVPVNARRGQGGAMGNRVSLMLVPLPIGVDDPRQRLVQVRRAAAEAKQSGQTQGAELAEEIGEWTATSVIAQAVRLATKMRPYNLVVTNVRGPPVPLYLLGARMTAVYPMVPLYFNQALGIAVLSYDDGVYWGLCADWDSVPDLHELAGAMREELELLACVELEADGGVAALADTGGDRSARDTRQEHEA